MLAAVGYEMNEQLAAVGYEMNERSSLYRSVEDLLPRGCCVQQRSNALQCFPHGLETAAHKFLSSDRPVPSQLHLVKLSLVSTCSD
jgi:hypothetical protein